MHRPQTVSRRVAARAIVAVAMGAVVMGGGGSAAAAYGPAAASASSSAASSSETDPDGPSESFTVDVPDAPGSADTIGIDVDLYLPSRDDPAPAVMLAHGFGGSKRSLDADAERLREDGFVVLTYSARGFGDSGGRISLDSLDYEVADASRLVDVLADRPEVELRGGDPVVGVYGPSYGGALALMLGATDARIDTVVASVTWNDLAEALVPGSGSGGTAAGADGAGVFKQAWATRLFGAAASPSAGPCGRFAADFCALYTRLVEGGRLDADDERLLAASSPASVLDGMTAPTLLLQGRQDTLFGFDQADANARQIAAAGAPVTVSWIPGGHDGRLTDGSATLVTDWLTRTLGGGTRSDEADDAVPLEPGSFSFAVPASARGFDEIRVADGYPGIDGDGGSRRLELDGRRSVVVNPPGGLPATISSLPGTGPLDSFLAGSPAALGGVVIQPAQVARFTSEPLDEGFLLVGAPTVSVEVGLPRSREGGLLVDPATAARDVVLFAQLRVISGDSSIAVGGGVVPVRVTLPADGSTTTVPITLPATTWRFERGDEIRVSLRTTDAGYRGSTEAASFSVDIDDDAAGGGLLTLPTVASSDPAVAGGSPDAGSIVGIVVVLALGSLLVLIAALAGRRTRSSAVATAPTTSAADATPAAAPLVITGLTLDFSSDFRAVDHLSFSVERGQVLGLLGPNGAGKTTTLRMVTGLLRPDSGRIEIFGERVTPGARVLERVGCFIEGPGFLPHLSGRRNLQLYWAASGRAATEARLAEVLEIADLGPAIERRVGGYSQGMRQRLAIAQAMLGMPELLILDEPTNGLDPPQIFALRGVLRRYAESGRTVIVSSHLLGEVEQTCSHVVVMARGRLLAQGTVAEIAGESDELSIEVTDARAAVTAIERLAGASALVTAPTTLRVEPGAHSAESIVEALVGGGVGVRSVTRGRHLEETFLAMVGSEGVR
jgi:ABC-2 type transport system ATP-binding protein